MSKPLKTEQLREFSFEKLKTWQKARILTLNIYKMTNTLPEAEKFGLVSQMRRCSISISSNIAEGTGRHTNKDKARFTEIAYSSTLELLNHIIIANDLDFIEKSEYELLRNDISEITVMLDALYKSQLKNVS